MRMTACVAATVLASVSLCAQPAAPPVSGSFTSRDVTFDVAGAVAFNGASAMDKANAAILVAISNDRLNAGALADFVDRKLAVEKLIKDEKTAVVYLEFTPQGRFRGLSYYFGSGNGCGFCTSEVASTVMLANGKLSPGRVDVWNRANGKGDVNGYVKYLAEDHPMNGVKITKGWATADKASLLIEGQGEAGNLAGEVLLVNSKGAWGVDEELLDVVIN